MMASNVRTGAVMVGGPFIVFAGLTGLPIVGMAIDATLAARYQPRGSELIIAVAMTPEAISASVPVPGAGGRLYRYEMPDGKICAKNTLGNQISLPGTCGDHRPT